MSETTTVEPEQSDAVQQAQINLTDLQNVMRIIDVAAERGTFKGNELTAVGATRDRIAAFLASVETEKPQAEKLQ